MCAVALIAEPCQADVVVMVKFGGVQLARFKGLQDRIVAHGRSSEVEFHRDLFPSK
jgi:hypothetical protein